MPKSIRPSFQSGHAPSLQGSGSMLGHRTENQNLAAGRSGTIAVTSNAAADNGDTSLVAVRHEASFELVVQGPPGPGGCRLLLRARTYVSSISDHPVSQKRSLALLQRDRAGTDELMHPVFQPVFHVRIPFAFERF